MPEHHVARDSRVRQALRKRKARAGRGQGLEAEMLEITGGANVPGIGDHETSLFVEGPKGAAFIGNGRQGHVLLVAAPVSGRYAEFTPLDAPGGGPGGASRHEFR